ncbi:uncharacterized protein LOC114945102 [Nylanderia fulva]|uniref:uncharacterized protein LOC114945102 n=1 Tax=Nylanderia fulva TaxID=613905 RepID=UPI0010FAF475|nr:uncharacterized protein LOC114945102 [Nylanderia fulva]
MFNVIIRALDLSERPTNSCDFTSRDATFDLNTYEPYLDKIREIFVPSLEYRIHSLLEEFVYSRDSRWAVQFPYFKKFIDAIVAWRDPLIKATEYDIGTMERAIRSTVKRVARNDLVSCFLDSIILYYRLNKICRELDALGIDDDILRRKKLYRASLDRNPDMDCNVSSKSSCDAKGQTRCESAIELRTNIDCPLGKKIEQPTTSKCSQIVDSNQDLQPKGDAYTRDKEAIKMRKLKMIVRKTYQEDCNTFSGSVVTCLGLPCKPRDLIERIFEADPPLAESCLIVMKRRFLMNIYNVCSCLNDLLQKLDVEFARTLHLNCEIHPGYVGFRLRGRKVNKFVARIPICQNVRRRTIQRGSVVSTRSSSLSRDAEEGSKCSERCDNEGKNLHDTLSCVDEESEEEDDTCCSPADRDFKDTIMSRNECLQDLTTIAEETCNVTPNIDNSGETDENCHEISLDSMELENCQKSEEMKCEGKIWTNDDSSSSSENLVEMNRGIEEIPSDKEPSKCDCQTRSLDREPNLEDCNAHSCSIASFQDSERDKQLVELSCNRSLDNDIIAIDERLEDDDSLNSARPEIGDSASHRDDFMIIDSIPGVIASLFEASREDLDVISVKRALSNKDSSEDSLTVSVRTSRLRVSSKGINVNVSRPRTVVCSTSEEDASLSAKIRDVEVADKLSAPTISRKVREIPRDKRLSDKTRGFIRPSRGDSKSVDISEEKHLRATSNPARCCKFIASEFEKSRESGGRLSKLRVSSSNGFRSATSFTRIKCGTASRKDRSAKVRSRTMLVKFRDSIDRSVDRIKRLIHARLRKILFDGTERNASRTSWKDEEYSEDTTRVRTSGRCVRQDYSITSCSTSNCCYRHSCILSSRESSNVILSIRRDRHRKGMKFCDRRLTGGRETLSTFRSIEASYDSLTSAVEDLEERKLSRGDRRKRLERSVAKNSRDFRQNYTGTGTTISSTEVSGNESRYLQHYAINEQREKTRDVKRDRKRNDEGIRNRWKREHQRLVYREIPMKLFSNESLGTSSYTRKNPKKSKNVHKQSRSDRSKRGFAFSGKNRQMENVKNRLRERRVIQVLNDVYNDYTDDLDLDLKLHLLRYVELCKNVKRALTKTLRSDFYEFEYPMAIYG